MIHSIINLIPVFLPGLAPFQANTYYLDPGSGSLLLQVLLAALLGGAYAVRVYWKRIKKLINRDQPAGEDVEKKETDGK